MQMIWLTVAIVATVGYHLVLKVTPLAANPYLSLAVTYAIVTAVFVALYAALPGAASLREALLQLNWTALALAGAIVFLDLGFLMLYRSGFNVSLGQLVTQSAAALLLLLLGVAFFHEKLSLANVGGILLCVVGLWLINRR
jgi:multidrug transporter EmrE-like cation transporter